MISAYFRNRQAKGLDKDAALVIYTNVVAQIYLLSKWLKLQRLVGFFDFLDPSDLSLWDLEAADLHADLLTNFANLHFERDLHAAGVVVDVNVVELEAHVGHVIEPGNLVDAERGRVVGADLLVVDDEIIHRDRHLKTVVRFNLDPDCHLKTVIRFNLNPDCHLTTTVVR